MTIKDVLGAMNKDINFKDASLMNVYSPNIILLNPGNSLNDALNIMLDRKFNQMPITYEGEIIGIVTLKSLFEAFVKFINELKSDVKSKGFDEYIKVIWQSK